MQWNKRRQRKEAQYLLHERARHRDNEIKGKRKTDENTKDEMK